LACSANTVCVAQHCDNSGWKKAFVPREGLLIRAERAGGSDFANDASYLTMPAGWQAMVIVKSPTQTQIVGQSSGWSFCQRGGFNDQVSEIVISRAPAPTKAPTQVCCLLVLACLLACLPVCLPHRLSLPCGLMSTFDFLSLLC